MLCCVDFCSINFVVLVMLSKKWWCVIEFDDWFMALRILCMKTVSVVPSPAWIQSL